MLLISIAFFLKFERMYAKQTGAALSGGITPASRLPVSPSLGDSNDVP
jgi:hypothetical protein